MSIQQDKQDQDAYQLPLQINKKQQEPIFYQQKKQNKQEQMNQINQVQYSQNNSGYMNDQNKQQEHRIQNQAIYEQNSFQQTLTPEDLKMVQNHYQNPMAKDHHKNQQLSSNALLTTGVGVTLPSNSNQIPTTYSNSGGIINPINTQQIQSNYTLNPNAPLLSEREQLASTEEGFNYCTEANGARIMSCTSYSTKCHPQNLLNPIRNNIWMSEEGLPQSIVIDLSNLVQKTRFFKCIGFDCWHDYSTNPAVIEILVSTDGQNFITWVTLKPELKAGIQLFSIDPLGKRYYYIKFTIKETHGASKVYMNCLYLLEDNPMIKLNKLSNLTQQSLAHQTEVISPSNKNMSVSYKNNSKDNIQIHTSPAQNVDLQTQNSPQNAIQFNHQQNQNLIQRRSPILNQYIHQIQQHPAYFHSQSQSGGYPPNYAQIENQNQSYPEEYNQQLIQQQRLNYQNDVMNQLKPNIQNNYSYQHQIPNHNLLQQKIQNNCSGVEDDYRLMNGSMVNNQHPPIDYQRQNIIEDTRSMFLDQNNNSTHQMYSPYQIVDNFMSFSARKSYSNQPKNQEYNSPNQNEFEKYVHPYDQQFPQSIDRQSLIQQQQLKQSQEQMGQNSWQDSRRHVSNSNQQQNTADFQSDIRYKLDGNDQNYRIASVTKSLKSSGQISPQPNLNNERQIWMQMDMKYKEEINVLQKDLVNAQCQISSLGFIVEKMQDTKNQMIEKIALIAESLSLLREEVYQRLDLVEKDVAFVNTNQNTQQGDKILKEDDLISSIKNGDRSQPLKIEPQKSTSQPSLNTKQDILEKYLPRKNSSNHHLTQSPCQEQAEQQKSLSTVVNNVLDKKLQDLEASLSRTLMKSLHQIQQTQTAAGDRLSFAKDSYREISPILYQSGQSSSHYPRISSPQMRQQQSMSVRESQLNGLYSHGNSNENLLNVLSPSGLSHLKKNRENEYFGAQSAIHNHHNIVPNHSYVPLSQTKNQDQKNSKVIQLLDKLQSKLAQRQNKVEELNEKEKRLKQKKDKKQDIQNKENKERSKQKRIKEQKPQKQLYSEESYE